MKLADERLREQHGVFGQIVAREDIPSRTDLGEIPNSAKGTGSQEELIA